MAGFRGFLKARLLAHVPVPLALIAKQAEVVLRCALVPSYYEPEAAVFLGVLRAVGRRGTAIDVGANLGQYALPLARLGCCEQVLAIEPQQRHLALLRRTAGLFGGGKIACVQALAGAEPGVAEVILPRRWGAPAPQEAYMQGRGAGGAVCSVIALDSLVSAAQPVIAVKLDIEGAELLALRGARSLLARDRPPVLAELSEVYLARFGADRGAVFAFMQALGYLPYGLRAGRSGPRPGQPPPSANYFFLQPAQAAALRSGFPDAAGLLSPMG